jgi:hypothetical protein
MAREKGRDAALKRNGTPVWLLGDREERGLFGGLYTAKLLFEFLVIVDGAPGVRRLCEERMILIEAESAKDALAKAKRQGRESQYRYRNSAGDPVRFRFVGVMDLLHLGVECANNEVWYTITQRVRPMERRKEILPHESRLCAVLNERRLGIHQTTVPRRKK